MARKKAPNNRTIDTTVEDGSAFLERCLRMEELQSNVISEKRKYTDNSQRASVTDENRISLCDVLDRTILGDTMQVLPQLPEACADLIIVDPPYNRTKVFGKNQFSRKKAADYEEYTREWVQLAAPLLKETGSIYVCCDWESSLIIGRVLGEYFQIRNRITWQREKGRGARMNWKNGMEDIWFATKSDAYTFQVDAVKVRRRVIAPYRENGKPKDWTESEEGNYRDTCPSNFWDDITIPFWSMPENTEHPTQKPEKLLAKIILASSNKGDVVLDPFLGSGSTSVTAKKLGRHYIGIEREEQYCVWAEQRLEMAEQDPRIQGYVNGIFLERNAADGRRQKGKSLLTERTAEDSGNGAAEVNDTTDEM